jgi:ABC-type sugar transport system ATPase subunit
MTLGDRIAVMHQGRMQQLGRPLELYDRPANLFVAGFLGSPEMNFLPGTLDRSSGTVVLDAGRVALRAGRVAAPMAAAAETRVVAGIRPDHLSLVGHAEPGSIPLTVQRVEQMGAQTLLMSKLDAASVTILTARNDRVRAGDTIGAAVTPENVHLFDAETQQSLGRTPA